MFEELGAILSTLKDMLTQMNRSNDNMEKLTKQLEILTLPPDMVKWAKKRNNDNNRFKTFSGVKYVRDKHTFVRT